MGSLIKSGPMEVLLSRKGGGTLDLNTVPKFFVWEEVLNYNTKLYVWDTKDVVFRFQ